VLTPERRAELQERFERHESDLPCAFPWVSEPDVLGRTGKPTKRKAPPKKCTRGCRQFVPRELPGVEDFAPYTDEEIQAIELDTFGVYLTSTPFDKIPEEVKEQLSTGVDILVGDGGDYMLAAVVKGLRPHTTRGGDPMGFLSVMTEQGALDITVFPKYLALYEGLLVPGTFLFLAVHKNDRGLSLQHAALPGGDD
jgi:DNA polymerase-3 subunit alpha